MLAANSLPHCREVETTHLDAGGDKHHGGSQRTQATRRTACTYIVLRHGGHDRAERGLRGAPVVRLGWTAGLAERPGGGRAALPVVCCVTSRRRAGLGWAGSSAWGTHRPGWHRWLWRHDYLWIYRHVLILPNRAEQIGSVPFGSHRAISPKGVRRRADHLNFIIRVFLHLRLRGGAGPSSIVDSGTWLRRNQSRSVGGSWSCTVCSRSHGQLGWIGYCSLVLSSFFDARAGVPTVSAPALRLDLSAACCTDELGGTPYSPPRRSAARDYMGNKSKTKIT